MGPRWRLCLPGELARAFPYVPAHLADVSYPWRLEQSHAMLIGTTGMGKTVALSDMIEEARERGNRAVIFDLTGSFIEHFYDPEHDVILNPLDARCPQWSVFDECRDEAEFSAAAEALVPHDGGGHEQFWVLAARLLFVEMCLKLRAQGKASNEALAQQLMTADLTQVHKLMRGTIADPLTAPEAARMAESIRAVFNANAKALKLLPRSGPRFSVRQWVEDEAGPGSMVFVSARYVDMSVCSQLLTVWLDTAMNTLMAMSRTTDLRLWFFIDELGALHRLPALEKGLQTARNFGGAIVTGIHAYAKLKEVYGENMAMTLSSLARTKLILGTADRETATWCSDFIGHRQVREMEEGYTYGYNNARDAVSLTPRKHIEPLLLPDQLMNLPRLSGYLKFPDGFPAAPIRLVPTTRPRVAEGFIRRAADVGVDTGQGSTNNDTADDARQASGSDEHPSSNDDGAGRPVEARQGELPLANPASATIAGEHEQPRARAADTMDAAMRGEELVPLKGSGNADDQRASEDAQAASRPTVPLSSIIRSEAGEGELSTEGTVTSHPQAARRARLGDPQTAPERARTSEQRAAAEARRLMLEDGARDADRGPRDGPELGDIDLDI
jgi:type IV conjugative transfer system coupling protein TraD